MCPPTPACVSPIIPLLQLEAVRATHVIVRVNVASAVWWISSSQSEGQEQEKPPNPLQKEPMCRDGADHELSMTHKHVSCLQLLHCVEY